MITDFSNPTQITGLIVFALAAGACLHAARSARGADRSRWKAMASVQALFFIEVLVGIRHRLHDWVDGALQAGGLYESRSGLQVSLLMLVLIAIGAGVVVAWRWRRTHAGIAVAMAGSALTLAVFAIEMVSLHIVDAVLYARVGPVMLVALLWAAAAFIVARSALHSTRRRRHPIRA